MYQWKKLMGIDTSTLVSAGQSCRTAGHQHALLDDARSGLTYGRRMLAALTVPLVDFVLPHVGMRSLLIVILAVWGFLFDFDLWIRTRALWTSLLGRHTRYP
jgi:hypothetical protein